MDMRVKIIDLLESSGRTAYDIAHASRKRITVSTIYRLKKSGGRMEYFNAPMLEALCEVLDITDMNDLFARDPAPEPARETRPAPPSGKPASKKGKRKAKGAASKSKPRSR